MGLSQTIVGPLSDSKGRVIFVVCGLVLAAGGLSTFPFTARPWIFVSLGLASLGLGTFCVALIALVIDRAHDSMKATVSGAYYLFWGIGYFLVPAAFGLLGRNLSLGFLLLAGLLLLEAIVVTVRGIGSRRPRDPVGKRAKAGF